MSTTRSKTIQRTNDATSNDDYDDAQAAHDTPPAAAPGFFNMTMTDTVARFSGEDITHSAAKWAEDIEDNAEIFGWTPQQQLIIARRSLTGTAELWLRAEKAFKTYSELKVALLKEFPDDVNVKQMHEIMSARKKNKSESCYQYMLIMKELGRRAKFPDYVAIQYIIDGIPDYEPNKAVLYEANTYTKLKEKMTVYETIKGKMLNNRERCSVQNQPKPNLEEPSNSRCYKCGDRGHMSNACVNGVKCFRCNSYDGHIGAQCKASQRQTQDMKTVSEKKTMCIREPSEGAAVSSEVAANDVNESTEIDRMNDSSQCFVPNFCSSCQCQNILTVNIDGISNKSVTIAKMCGISVKTLIDTGSEINLVTTELFKKLNISRYEQEKTVLVGLGSYKIMSMGKFSYDFIIDGHRYNACFHVVERGIIPYEIILGQTFLANTVILITKGDVKVRPLTLKRDLSQMCLRGVKKRVVHLQESKNNYKPEKKIRKKKMTKDEVPVAHQPRRLALTEENVVKKKIEDSLLQDEIRTSRSEHTSPEKNRSKVSKKRKIGKTYREKYLVSIWHTRKSKFAGPYQATKLQDNDRYEDVRVNSNSNAEGSKKAITGVDFMKSWGVT